MPIVPNPIMSKELFRRGRASASLTQDQLGQLLGIARATVNRIETGVCPIQVATGLHAALLFAWLAKHAETKKPAPRGRPANLSYCYARVEGGNMTGLEVEAMAPGSRYRMMTMHGSTFSRWNTYVRGPGTRHEDQAETANPPLTDAQWLDETTRHYE